jgi:hypothetical protein
MSVFLAEVSPRHAHEFVLLGLDGAGIEPSACRYRRTGSSSYDRLGAPPLNPLEQVWDEGREKWFANRVFARLNAVEEQLLTALKTWEEDSARVASVTGFEWIKSIPLNAH